MDENQLNKPMFVELRNHFKNSPVFYKTKIIMKILIVDNYDSFTYNLAHYVSTYNQNLKVVRYDKIKIDMINDYDKIIFSLGQASHLNTQNFLR